ncbi:MAG: hypothetical protein VZR95_01290 [Alphaproteobacteria bacterium]
MKTLVTAEKVGKIGIDFHGVINTDPEFFQKLSQELLRRRIEIHIISGGPEEYIKNYLHDNNIFYSQIWCIYSYYENKGQITVCEDGSFYMDDELWNKAKADYCCRHKIGLHIDDSSVYGRYFTTPYCLYNGNTKTGRIFDHQINFAGSAELCADQLISVLK